LIEIKVKYDVKLDMIKRSNALPFVKVVNSSLPLSNVLTSSGEFIDFFSIGAALAADVDILLLIISWG
jgi:hypothetical protein